MSTSVSFPKSSPQTLASYFVMALALTWSVFGLIVLAARGVTATSLSTNALLSIATLGPALAAITISARESGWVGVRALLAQAGRWRVRPLWYGVAVLLPALVMLLSFLLWRLLGGPQLPAPSAATWLSVPILALALTIPGLFEEIGWRGYAFPRLQSRSNALTASLILGLFHALFHWPLWLVPGLGFDTLPFPFYVLLTVGVSILSGWLYNSTKGSVLIVALLHGAINATPAPWGAALQLLPAGTEVLNIQLPVAIVIFLFGLIVVLKTDLRSLTRRTETQATGARQ